jgi:LysM repeat protein
MRRRFILGIIAAWLAIGAVVPNGSAQAASPPNTARDSAREYVVQPGDTLLGIAISFGVSMAAIQALNDIADPGLIQAGQTLKIPAAEMQPGENAWWTLYVVQPGDTLSAIAARFQLPMVELARVNKLANTAIIRVGQKLVIPTNGLAEGPAAPQRQSDDPPAQAVELIPLVPIAEPEPASQAAEAQRAPVAVPSNMPRPSVTSPRDANNAEIETARARLLELYNQARMANGVPPLAYSFVLQAAAQAHAEDCAARGSGSHIGSDGSRSSQRIARAGYAGRITGENWAWARSADQAFEMWYTQEIATQGPHLKNILSPRYTEVGFGIAPARGGYFLIANFGG